ncbi:hypothetical protein TREMEDRAFT_66472 [Tremella mesenterica DSM 1558]|uniref:uncharacterized protein n=1 Tax=Tremella mesenterica (strain ATCC 24925 / CBS 8224 / DSM 1558 / NBRC 9311 / NRRL Y-6157 / RJB 2259-6 / UBC 559-6) TaxID=578456 RepID=UPI00032CF1F1|nr:uncharacterized protein TREMEDRAFT_66472 [Tremella mesenterica DSM 1558]EIW65558.1 hypothetical protein TREMEDRAFT_66472 [Tremella mesenterica DSM 1558]
MSCPCLFSLSLSLSLAFFLLFLALSTLQEDEYNVVLPSAPRIMRRDRGHDADGDNGEGGGGGTDDAGGGGGGGGNDDAGCGGEGGRGGSHNSSPSDRTSRSRSEAPDPINLMMFGLLSATGENPYYDPDQ